MIKLSKYSNFWEYIKNQNADSLKLTYDEIEQIAGVLLVCEENLDERCVRPLAAGV